jgi:type II secretory pathway component PulM
MIRSLLRRQINDDIRFFEKNTKLGGGNSMKIRRNVILVMGLFLSLALAFTLMSCATTDQMTKLEKQVQQASQDAKDAKALAQDSSQQAKQADAAAVRAENAADAAAASAQKAEDMANKAEAIFNQQMKK